MKFVVDKNIPLVEKALKSLGEVIAIGTGAFSRDAVRDADVLIVRSETKVGSLLLDGSRVKFVGTATIGMDHIDLDYLASRGIAFASAPGCNSNSVKEYVVAALLSLSNNHGIELRGKTIGVVGVGNVGSKVAQTAEALGMTVLQNDPPLARMTGEKRFLPLNELMSADIITLHVPLTRSGQDSTYHLFNGEGFHRLKPGMIFINTSRGAVVETAALKEAIRQKQIAAAVIDVWENEPVIDPELLSLATIGSAHIAGYSLEGKTNAIRIIREALCSHFGISSTWDPTIDIPQPDITQIAISGDPVSENKILHQAVKQCYDISYDDHQLRRILSMREDERPEYFRNLRSGYRIRREFFNVTIQLPSKYTAVGKIFNVLGFKKNIIK